MPSSGGRWHNIIWWMNELVNPFGEISQEICSQVNPFGWVWILSDECESFRMSVTPFGTSYPSWAEQRRCKRSLSVKRWELSFSYNEFAPLLFHQLLDIDKTIEASHSNSSPADRWGTFDCLRHNYFLQKSMEKFDLHKF